MRTSWRRFTLRPSTATPTSPLTCPPWPPCTIHTCPNVSGILTVGLGLCVGGGGGGVHVEESVVGGGGGGGGVCVMCGSVFTCV